MAVQAQPWAQGGFWKKRMSPAGRQVMEDASTAGTGLDSALARLRSELEGLNRRKFCAFFAACGEGLFPLYERFSENSNWGSSAALRRVMEIAWLYAMGAQALSDEGPILLSEIERLTPDGEVFDTPESTFAQDVAICVDASIRAATEAEFIDPAWVEYVLEPAVSCAREEETGYLDLGSGLDATAWRNGALKNPKVAKAYQTCLTLLEILKAEDTVDPTLKETLTAVASGLPPRQFRW